jgi:two-component system response regulator HydG
MARILVAEDDQVARDAMAEILAAGGHQVDTAADGEAAVALVRQHAYQLVITDLNMPKQDGMAVLRETLQLSPETRVMMVTAYGTIDKAVEAMRQGAADFMAKPVSIEALELKVNRLLEESTIRQERDLLQEEAARRTADTGMVSRNRQMLAALEVVRKVADTASCVLITGESGTGKELVARAVHAQSGRRAKPLVTVNCAALASGVLESELFGHEKGAFTGALQRRIGRFEQAHQGTLFLDEIGDLPPETQVKLLRVLQEKCFERVGGNETIRVDVRIIAATHQDLAHKIKQGGFREDLYYRLNVVPVHLVPLRERKEDVPLLVEHFLKKFSRELGKEFSGIHPEALQVLEEYSWPGNVRELENIVERGVVLGRGPRLAAADLPALTGPAKTRDISGDSLDAKKANLEQEIIIEALKKAKNKQVLAAELLGMDRTTLRYRMKKYGLL